MWCSWEHGEDIPMLTMWRTLDTRLPSKTAFREEAPRSREGNERGLERHQGEIYSGVRGQGRRRTRIRCRRYSRRNSFGTGRIWTTWRTTQRSGANSPGACYSTGRSEKHSASGSSPSRRWTWRVWTQARKHRELSGEGIHFWGTDNGCWVRWCLFLDEGRTDPFDESATEETHESWDELGGRSFWPRRTLQEDPGNAL